MNKNEKWAAKIIKRWDKTVKSCWAVFNEILADLQNVEHNCLDVGCGEDTELAEDLKFKNKFGTDLIFPKNTPEYPIPFLQSDLYYLPFKDNSYNLIILRFVVEHIKYPLQAFTEFNRILKPGGHVLILTTNICSPIIFLPRLLPYKIRKKLIIKLFKAGDDDLFPTYHRMNTKYSLKKFAHLFNIVDLKYVQDLNWTRRWIFCLFFFWHLLSKWFFIHFLRSNFITLLKKPLYNKTTS